MIARHKNKTNYLIIIIIVIDETMKNAQCYSVV